LHAVKAALRKKQTLLGGSEDWRVFRGRRLAEMLKDDFWRARLFIGARKQQSTLYQTDTVRIQDLKITHSKFRKPDNKGGRGP
jgi:hypothetical protein